MPINDAANSPSPGLDNNPGKDGILFNDHHPYFPRSCSDCPFAAAGKKLLALLGRRKKNCYECVKIDRNISTEKNKNRDIYNELLKNPDYYNVKYDEVSGGVYLLNGKPIKLKGVNRHDFNCRTGASVTVENVIEDMTLMKKLNVNAIRTSHYPNMPEFYQLPRLPLH